MTAGHRDADGLVRQIDESDLERDGWSTDIDHPQAGVVVGDVGVVARDRDPDRMARCVDECHLDRRKRVGDIDHTEASRAVGDVGVAAGEDDVLDDVRQCDPAREERR